MIHCIASHFLSLARCLPFKHIVIKLCFHFDKMKCDRRTCAWQALLVWVYWKQRQLKSVMLSKSIAYNWPKLRLLLCTCIAHTRGTEGRELMWNRPLQWPNGMVLVFSPEVYVAWSLLEIRCLSLHIHNAFLFSTCPPKSFGMVHSIAISLKIVPFM